MNLPCPDRTIAFQASDSAMVLLAAIGLKKKYILFFRKKLLSE
jgi:hypothetical protein